MTVISIAPHSSQFLHLLRKIKITLHIWSKTKGNFCSKQTLIFRIRNIRYSLNRTLNFKEQKTTDGHLYYTLQKTPIRLQRSLWSQPPPPTSNHKILCLMKAFFLWSFTSRYLYQKSYERVFQFTTQTSALFSMFNKTLGKQHLKIIKSDLNSVPFK